MSSLPCPRWTYLYWVSWGFFNGNSAGSIDLSLFFLLQSVAVVVLSSATRHPTSVFGRSSMHQTPYTTSHRRIFSPEKVRQVVGGMPSKLLKNIKQNSSLRLTGGFTIAQSALVNPGPYSTYLRRQLPAVLPPSTPRY